MKGTGEEPPNRTSNAHIRLTKLPQSNGDCVVQSADAENNKKKFLRGFLKAPNTHQNVGRISLNVGEKYFEPWLKTPFSETIFH